MRKLLLTFVLALFAISASAYGCIESSFQQDEVKVELPTKKITVKIQGCYRDGEAVIVNLLIGNTLDVDDYISVIGDTRMASATDHKKKLFYNAAGTKFLFSHSRETFQGRIEEIMVPAGAPVKVTLRIENFNPDSPCFTKLTFGLTSKANPYGWNSEMPVVIKNLQINN